MYDLILYLFAGLFGAAVGSFLNVCICRWPADESVVSPPSRCPGCGQRIGWRDNVPVLGWLLLRGRCRTCREPVSVLYPAVELGAAGIWVLASVVFGFNWQALGMALFFTILLGIAATDARTYIIPNEFTYGGLAIGLLLALAPGGLTVLESLLGAAVGFGLLYLVAVGGEWWLGKPAMGGGDIKMMAMVGAFLGPWGALLTIFSGALVGTIVFLPISLRTEKLVPFGIFLSLGAFVTALWGDEFVAWYASGFLN
jgi:leader peptidase (prepilin peptidase) / N-methyltransferase